METPWALQPRTRSSAEFLSRSRRGEDVEIEELCAEHPERAEELKRLHADWKALGLADDAGAKIPNAAEDSVHVSGESADDAFWERFTAQLKSRGPGHSRYVLQGEIARGGMGVVCVRADG